MSHDHSHATVAHGNERALRLALLLTAAFLIAEVVAGIMTRSLALISDAAHMFTDSAALAIALVAIRMGNRPADKRRTFGYARFEILAAALNAVLLFLVALYILYEAIQRFRSPPEIHSLAMMLVAAVGLGVNLLSMRLLSSGKDSSLNLKGAYLEVWSDMLGSIGVIVGAAIIYFTHWAWVDSVIAVGIGLWVLPRTWTLLRESLNILLEGVPAGVGLSDIEIAILASPGVASVHDLHVWALSSNKLSLTVHVVTNAHGEDNFDLLTSVRKMLAGRFGVTHSTVQLERVPCEQAARGHTYDPPVGQNAHEHERGPTHGH